MDFRRIMNIRIRTPWRKKSSSSSSFMVSIDWTIAPRAFLLRMKSKCRRTFTLPNLCLTAIVGIRLGNICPKIVANSKTFGCFVCQRVNEWKFWDPPGELVGKIWKKSFSPMMTIRKKSWWCEIFGRFWKDFFVLRSGKFWKNSRFFGRIRIGKTFFMEVCARLYLFKRGSQFSKNLTENLKMKI